MQKFQKFPLNRPIQRKLKYLQDFNNHQLSGINRATSSGYLEALKCTETYGTQTSNVMGA